ncbi:ribokinase [Anaerobium acetethylicum]|uniref:Ribokinase n=1 Tax=Anaerobium acetethylicum TaxID=1619234 RepID=A0A1D3TVP9_9FIRM|nr:ribokinase [Anaerobium acetethylicum]SCP98252.1 ribokinase [Anaerobium acetethylicum]
MKIGILGSINMDMTVTADRIPQKGETIKGNDISYIPGGKGANQAVAAARLGGSVEMFGCVGNDDAGKTLVENLRNEGIQTGNIKVVDGVPTGIAVITVAENDNCIVVVAGANNAVDKAYVDSVADDLLACDIVLLQHEIPQETVEYAVQLCHKKGIKVILNPAPARPVPKKILEQIDYLTPNEHEAVILFGQDTSTEDLLKTYPEKLVITQGSLGVSVCTGAGDVVLVPARKAKVVDTTGAGDTLNGAFAVALADGKDIVGALKFANVAASLSTEKFGAQGGMPVYEEVIQEME